MNMALLMPNLKKLPEEGIIIRHVPDRPLLVTKNYMQPGVPRKQQKRSRLQVKGMLADVFLLPT